MAWEAVASTHELIQGDTYRVKFVITYPWSTDFHLGIVNALKGYNAVQSDIVVDTNGVAAYILPDDPLAYGSRNAWLLAIPFKKVKGNTPILIIAGLIIAAIAIPVILGAIFSKQFDHFVGTASDATSKTLTDLVPVGILVVAAIFLLR